VDLTAYDFGAFLAPDPLPTLPVYRVQGSGLSTDVYAPKWLSAVLTAWLPPDPLPTLTGKVPQGAISSRPIYAPVWPHYAYTPWIQPDPLPTLTARFGQGLYVNPGVTFIPVPMGAGPYVHSFAVTPAALGATVFKPPTRALFVGGAGNLQVVMNGDAAAVILVGALAGTIYPLSVTQVISTSTTATSIFGLW